MEDKPMDGELGGMGPGSPDDKPVEVKDERA